MSSFYQTASDADANTDGMIRTSTVDLILEKLESGVRWIVITGAPGEGKTTLGFLVMKDMLEKGYSAVNLAFPEEYSVVTDNSDENVIFMLDGVLGAFDYDSVESSKWKTFIIGVHENIMLRQKYGKYGKGCFLFIGRRNVFQAASEEFGKHEDSIFHKHVFDLNEKYQLTAEERLQVLDHHLSGGSIAIPEHDKLQVSSDKLVCPHGFPHCCKMFVELHKMGQQIDLIKFFASPLLFLDQTTKVLLKETNTKTFFKELLKGNGELDIDEIEDDNLRDIMSETKTKLLGIYVKNRDNQTQFSHPSVYESVALTIGKRDNVFIVKYCHVTFIMQRVKVKQREYGRPNDYIYVNLETEQICNHLSSAFAKSISQGLFSVIEHEACEDDKLLRMTLQKSRPEDDDNRLMDQALCKRTNKSGYTLFHVAVECGNMTAIRILLEMGSDVNLPCPGWWWREGRTALHVLCMKVTVDVDVISRMIQYGADINMGDSHDTTVVHRLCGRKEVHDGIIKSVIELNADVTADDRYGKTALHYLCERQQVDTNIIDVLTDHGTSVNKADIHGKTVLHYMCLRNDADTRVIESLIMHGAEVNICDHSDKTAVHYACEGHAVKTDIINLLIKHGGDINMADGLKKLPLHYVCEKDVIDVNLLEFLVKRGADVNSTQSYGKTALHYMCEMTVGGNVVESFIELGANVNLSSDYGKTAIHYACEKDDTNISVIDALVRHDADTNIGDIDGATALHYVCMKDPVDTELLELMIRHGADVNLGCIHGRTALHHINMRTKENIPAMNILIQHGANVSLGHKVTFLHRVCSMAEVDIDILDTVVKHCSDVNACIGDDSTTPLHSLCDKSEVDIATVDCLIQHGLDINATDSSGNTALHCIDRHAKDGHERDVLLSQMTDRGADPQKQNREGRQAISSREEQQRVISTQRGLTDLMTNIIRGKLLQYLVSTEDKDLAKRGVFGRTALHHLCLSENIDKEILTLLSQHSEVNMTDGYGNTPLHCLSRRDDIESIGHLPELVDILIRHGADINMYDEYGVSALYYLRRVMDLKLIGILTSNYLDLDIDNCDGVTLLHFLCIVGYSDCLEMVLPKVKDVNKSVTCRLDLTLLNGMTALHLACQELHDDGRSVQMLLEAGADAHKTDEDGRTPLHLASDDSDNNTWTLPEMRVSSTYGKGDKHKQRYNVCCQLTELGADKFRQTINGQQALHGRTKEKYEERVDQKRENNPCQRVISAILSGRKDAVQDLIHQHKAMTEKDAFGRTVLQYFCLGENIDKDILALILQYSDVNMTDRYGNTALHCLTKRPNNKTIKHFSELIEDFLRQGADVNLFDEFGHRALFYLREVMDCRLMTVLTSSGADLNEDTGDGMTLLHYLCVMGPIECLKQIIVRVEDVNKPVSQDVVYEPLFVQGSTALHLVCRTQDADVEVVKMLIQKGADVNAKDRLSRTPLHIICDKPKKMCNLRLHWRAFPSEKNTSKARKAICQLLLEKGANRYLLDNDEQPALQGYFQYKFK